MTDAIDAALTLAAASPDAALRGWATKYYKLKQELAEAEGFLAFYAKYIAEAKMSAVATSVRATHSQDRPTTPRRSGTMATGKRGQVDEFVRLVCDMLRAEGAPLPMTTLYERFFQQHREFDQASCSVDTFRQRLNKKPHLITSQDHRYWPTDTPWPETNHSLAA